ncbi:MAG: family 20 glycosylhydrolase, partial [Promethearchaeota archaeon]
MKVIIFENLSDSEEQFGKIPILIPQPQEILTFSKDQSFKIESVLNLAFYNVEKESLFINNLNDFFSSMAEIKLNKKLLEKINDLDIKLPHENSESSYYFDISNNQALIASEGERGLFYGLQTFIQIVKNYFIVQNKDGRSQKRLHKIVLPQITIKDFSDIKMRGVAYDCSRGQIFSVKSAKRFIRILSHYKLNTMCLYIEDIFTHPKHPLIGKNRGAFTPEEIREIDEYAINHFIELIPIFECLGHVDNILQHKKYQDLGEFPGAHCLDISNPDVFPFLEDYISLMSETFSTKTFHIGCDESFDIGRHRSQDLIEKKGKGQALIDYYEKIYEITKKHGNERVIMYDDFVRKNEEVLEGLTRDITLMYWDYEPHDEYPAVKNLLDEGYEVIVSPSMLNWNRNFPDNKNASKNIIVLIDEAYTYKEEGCLGVLTSTWGDQRYFSLRENEIFGAVLTADKAWNCKKFYYDTFKRNYGYLFYGIIEKNLNTFQKLFTTLSSTPEYYYRLL